MSCMFSFCLLENLPQSTLSPKSMARIEGLEEGRPDGVRCSAVLHLWRQVKYCRQKNSVWIIDKLLLETHCRLALHASGEIHTNTHKLADEEQSTPTGARFENYNSVIYDGTSMKTDYGYRMQNANECTTKTQNAYYCNRTLSNFVWADMFRQSQARISE